MKNSKFPSIKVIFLIFLFAFLLRLVYLFQLKNTPLLENPILDAKFYDLWAKKISQGEWLGKEIFLMSPGYSYLLAIIYKIFGHNLFLVAFIQLLIGAVNVVLVYVIGKIVFNRSVGIIAGFLASIYGVSIFYESMLLKVVWVNFFNLLVLLLLFIWQERHQGSYSFSAGLLVGVSALFRPVILLFVPLVIVWFLVLRGEKEQSLKQLTYLIIGVILVISPITLRNYLISKELVLIDAHGGATFYAGNNPEGKGTFTELEFVRSDARFEHRDFIREAERILDKEVSFGEASTFWYSQGLKFIKNAPGKWAKLLGRKFFLFWNNYEYPININYYSAKEILPFLRLPLISFGLISPLALFGILLTRKKNGQVRLLFFYLLCILLTNLLFFVASEYKFPVIPILFIFSAYAIYWWFEKIKNRDYRFLLVSLIGLVILSIGTNWKVPQVNNTLHYSLGNAYLEKGDLIKAGEEYHQALKLTPCLVEANINLGNIYLEQGEYNLAKNMLRRAMMLRPDNPFIYNNLGVICLSQGNYQGAEDFFRKTLQIKIDYGPAYANLGELYYWLKEYEKAIKFLEQGLKVDPYLQNYYWLLRIYRESGNEKKAQEIFVRGVKKYEEEIAKEPEGGDIYSQLALFLMESPYENKEKEIDISIVDSAKKGLKFRPGAFGYYVLGRSYLFDNQIEEALCHFLKSLEFNPNDSETLLWVGRIYKYWLNQPEEAKEYFIRGLKINPQHPWLKKEVKS